MINTASFSFASIAYPQKVESVISYMETMAGLGNMAGPVLGSFIYTAVGFETTFFIFGGALTPIAIIIMFSLPKPSEVRER